MVKLFLSNSNQINRDVAVKEGKTEQCQICFQKRAISRPEGHVTRGSVKNKLHVNPNYFIFTIFLSNINNDNSIGI